MAAFGTSSTVQGALTDSEIASVIVFLRTWEGKKMKNLSRREFLEWVGAAGFSLSPFL